MDTSELPFDDKKSLTMTAWYFFCNFVFYFCFVMKVQGCALRIWFRHTTCCLCRKQILCSVSHLHLSEVLALECIAHVDSSAQLFQRQTKAGGCS